MVSLQGHKINFVSRYKENPADIKKKKNMFRALLPIIGIAAVLVLVEAFLLFRILFVIQPGINEANAFLNDANTKKQYEQALTLSEEAAEWQSKVNNLDTAKSNIQSFPMLTMDRIRALEDSAGNVIAIDTLQFSANSGVVQITGSTSLDQQDKVPAFIKSMKAAGVFADVVYYYGEEINTVDRGVNTYGLYPEITAESGYLFVFTVIGAMQGGSN